METRHFVAIPVLPSLSSSHVKIDVCPGDDLQTHGQNELDDSNFSHELN